MGVYCRVKSISSLSPFPPPSTHLAHLLHSYSPRRGVGVAAMIDVFLLPALHSWRILYHRIFFSSGNFLKTFFSWRNMNGSVLQQRQNFFHCESGPSCRPFQRFYRTKPFLSLSFMFFKTYLTSLNGAGSYEHHSTSWLSDWLTDWLTD